MARHFLRRNEGMGGARNIEPGGEGAWAGFGRLTGLIKNVPTSTQFGRQTSFSEAHQNSIKRANISGGTDVCRT
jgi:hypothetical protein